MSSNISNAKHGDLIWLGSAMTRDYIKKFCQLPRSLPGHRPTRSASPKDEVSQHFVIFLEKGTQNQKTFVAVEDFDVKVLSPTLGVFWLSSDFFITFDEWHKQVVALEERKKKRKNKGAKK